MCTIKEIQKVELDILKQIIILCKKYNLKYALAYGTLLGAIRHKGFIPWDDDVDIMMPRDDFEKFRTIAINNLPAPYFFQDVLTDPQYPSFTAKVRNSNTKFVEQGYKKLNKMNHGIWVDVFVVDKVKESKNTKRKILISKALNKLLLAKGVKSAWSIIAMFFSRRFLYKRIIKKLLSLHKKSFDYYMAFPDLKKIDKNIFENLKSRDFENIQANVPGNYEKILADEYDNWRQLPPESERLPRHYAGVVEINCSNNIE